MGVISPDNNLQFATTSELFDRVRKSLSSFDAAGQIDIGDFYHYVVEVLQEIGCAYYQEQEAFIQIRNYKGILPPNFYQLYAAYKCGHFSLSSEQICQDIVTEHFNDLVLLKLGSQVKPLYYDTGCLNRFARSTFEMTIDEGQVFTNFTGEGIYLQYYGMPADKETGLPLTPKEKNIENAIEYYIRFKVLEILWLNNMAPDLRERVQYLASEYEKHVHKAKYWAKLPTFQNMIAVTRQRRKRFDIYNRLTDSKPSWYLS